MFQWDESVEQIKNRASPVDLNTNDEHADLYEKLGGYCASWADWCSKFYMNLWEG